MALPYFFFRPMVGLDRGWSAIDWQSGATDDASPADFVRCFSAANVDGLANLLPVVINAEPAWLEQAAFIESFEASQVIVILPPSVLDNEAQLARCNKLHGQGYRLGIHIDTAGLVKQVPLAGFSYLQLGAAFARNEFPGNELVYATDAGFAKIATSVDSHEMFDWLSINEFHLFDSRFLTSRHPLFGKEPDLTRLKLLKLLTLVERDGDTHEIEAIFREEPKLSYNLLRLVNSVAVGARTRISNFSQAIAILGRRQLQRWLQLLIYANNLADGNQPNPLMQIAAARGHLMEHLSKVAEPKQEIADLGDKAFLIGLFSLLEVLINLPIKDILQELPLHDDVELALKVPNASGLLGQLLTGIVAGESGDHATAERIFAHFGIGPETHAKAQVAAYAWASRINDNAHDDT